MIRSLAAVAGVGGMFVAALLALTGAAGTVPVAPADRRRRPVGRVRSRISTSPGKTVSARRATPPRRSGTRSRTGVLSDVYYPTVDNTNVETLQYIVTDGSTFTDLQTRDMTYTVRAADDAAGWRAR